MSVKLQQVQHNYRLRNHFATCVNSLTPRIKLPKQGQLKQSLNKPSIYCFKKSWHSSRGARDSKIGKEWPESSRILDYILS